MRYFDFVQYKNLVELLRSQDYYMHLDIVSLESLNETLFYVKLLNKFCKAFVTLQHKNTPVAISLREEIGSDDKRYQKFKFYENVISKSVGNRDIQKDLNNDFYSKLSDIEADFILLNQIYEIKIVCTEPKELDSHYKQIVSTDLDSFSQSKMQQVLIDIVKQLKNRHKICFDLDTIISLYNEISSTGINIFEVYFLIKMENSYIDSVDYYANSIVFKKKTEKPQYNKFFVDNDTNLILTLVGNNRVQVILSTGETRQCRLKKAQYEFLRVLAEFYCAEKNSRVSFNTIANRLAAGVPLNQYLSNIYTHSKALRYQLKKGLCLVDKNAKTGQLFFYCEDSAFSVSKNLQLLVDENLKTY